MSDDIVAIVSYRLHTIVDFFDLATLSLEILVQIVRTKEFVRVGQIV